jgi:PAS domain S-box-containing protein
LRSAVFCLLGLGIVSSGAASPVAAADRPSRQGTEVLFLSSADPDLPDVAAMIEQTETHILNGSERPVHFNFEYVAVPPTLATPAPSTAESLLEKYRGQTFDLVIAINEETVPLAEQIRAKLFSNGALLFFVVNPKDPASWLNQVRGRTGVIEKLNFVPTLQLALRQNPGVMHVVVVSGSSDAERAGIKLASEQFHPYEAHLDFQYLTDLQFSELGPRLEHAPPDSVILFLNFATDSRGEQFVPSRILPAIAKSANRPIYGTNSSLVGGGVVGGSVVDLGEAGQVLGDDAARILKGEKPESIPVVSRDFQHYMIDWRQLQRWGISASEFPSNGEVLFREYSPWELYRWRILGLSALLLAETLLIALLLANISKRKHAQRALRRKEGELAEAQRMARLGNCLWDEGTDTLTWSEELYRIHGLDPLVPLPPYQELARLFTPESWGRLSLTIRELLHAGAVQDLDLEIVRVDGSKGWVTVRAEAVRNAAGDVTYLRGTVQDITERKQAEEARFRLASIVESSDDAIISRTLDGIIATWNRGAQHIFGFRESEVLGRHISILAPELREEEETISQKTKAGENVEHYETVRVTKEGKKIDVSLTISPLRDANGRIVGSSQIARDITERKRAEDELKKSEKRFRVMADSAPMLIWLSGPDTLATDFNKAWLEFTGRSMQEELGEGWTKNLHPDDLHRHLEAYADAFEKKARFVSEYRLRRNDGQYRWMLDQSVPRFLDDGVFAGYVGYCLDISDQKETAAARIELGGRFIHAQEVEREHIARELHDDINQRLALLANGLQEFEQSTSAKNNASEKKDLQELWRLTNDIATGIQQMSHHLHPSKLHYLGLAAAVRDLCQEVSRQHKFEIDCVVRDIPQDLGQDVSLSLFRTVQESLRNVAKHSHAHHIKVELTRQPTGIELRVSDDGVGFSPDLPQNNLGLGLVSMRERLRSVGGELTIWSRLSFGTQIKGIVPAVKPDAHRLESRVAETGVQNPQLSPVISDSSHGT